MATFESQVEGLTGLTISSSGTNPTQDELTQFLKDGIIDVINRTIELAPTETVKFTSSMSDSNNNGIAVTGKAISIVREHDSATILRPCTIIQASDRYEATDVDSLKYRSKYNPGYYELNGKIHTVPASAGSNNDSVVTGFVRSKLFILCLFINYAPNVSLKILWILSLHSSARWFAESNMA